MVRLVSVDEILFGVMLRMVVRSAVSMGLEDVSSTVLSVFPIDFVLSPLSLRTSISFLVWLVLWCLFCRWVCF